MKKKKIVSRCNEKSLQVLEYCTKKYINKISRFRQQTDLQVVIFLWMKFKSLKREVQVKTNL